MSEPKQRHVHADLMIDYAEDKNLKYEFFCDERCKWVLCTEQPLFHEDFQYRLHEREFPKTSLSDSVLEDIANEAVMKDIYDTYIYRQIANAAIRQYILDTEKESK